MNAPTNPQPAVLMAVAQYPEADERKESHIPSDCLPAATDFEITLAPGNPLRVRAHCMALECHRSELP